MARVNAIAVALAIAALASGCGDDDEGVFEEGSGPVETTTTTTDASTDTGAATETDGRDGGAPGASAPNACELLPEDRVKALIGAASKPEEKDGQTLDGFPLSQCVWERGEAGVAVAVVGSPERYLQHKKRGGDAVEDLGDAALVERGTSLEDRGGTGGRTVFVRDGERTLVVALNTGERETSVDAAVDLAREVHGRLR